MSDDQQTQISALIDNELERHEFAQISQKLQTDSELRAQLQRYMVISETMRGQNTTFDASGIAQAVNRALDDEPTLLAPGLKRKKPMPEWLKPVAGAAIAASVATLAVINLSNLGQQGDNTPEFPVTAVNIKPAQPVPFSQPRLAMPASTQWKTQTDTPDLEEELNRLLIDHSEFSAETGVTGMLPYASFVSYDQQ